MPGPGGIGRGGDGQQACFCLSEGRATGEGHGNGRRENPFKIGGYVIAPGARRTVEVPVSRLSDHTPVHLSVHVVHGRKPGPVLFVSAAIHGDEVIGVEIVRRLLGPGR